MPSPRARQSSRDDAGVHACLPVPSLYCRCFSEWLRPATSLPAFLRQDLFGPGGVTRFPSAEARLGALKRVFAQGLAIIRLLRAAGVTHNDLLLMNMLVRRHDKDSFQLAVSQLGSCAVLG
jgi:hypothetical protein